MLALLLLYPAASAQLTQPDGAHRLEIWQRTVVGRHGFQEAFDPTPLHITYSDIQLSLRGEWGLSDAWTAVLHTTPIGVNTFYLDSAGHRFDAFTDDWGPQVYTGTTLVGLRRAGLNRDAAPGAVASAFELRVGGTPPLGTLDREAMVYEGDAASDWSWSTNMPTLQVEGERQWGWQTERWQLRTALGGRWQSSPDLGPSLFGGLALEKTGNRADFTLDLSANMPLLQTGTGNIGGTGEKFWVGLEPGLQVALTDRTALTCGIQIPVLAIYDVATPAIRLGIVHR